MIDARGTAIGLDLLICRSQHIFAAYLVIQALRIYASDSPWLPGIASVAVLAPCLTACFELSQSRSASHIDTHGRSRGPSLRRGFVVLTIISTMTSSDSSIPHFSGFRWLPYTFDYAAG